MVRNPMDAPLSVCPGCNQYLLGDLPCANCDLTVRAAVESHDWETVDGIPTCRECLAKIFHRTAHLPCEWDELDLWDMT